MHCRLPCSRPPKRRRVDIVRAAAPTASPARAADDGETVAHVGPFILTREDVVRYIVPAAALRLLTSSLDGKGALPFHCLGALLHTISARCARQP